MSHTHTHQLLSRKNMLMAPELIKRKCLFQNVLYKSRYTFRYVLHVDLESSFEPCAGTANRRKDFQQSER